MQTVKVNGRHNGVTDYKADRPSQVKPVITGEIKDANGIVTHYECEGGKQYTKAGYDFNFGTVPTKIKPKHYKGKLKY